MKGPILLTACCSSFWCELFIATTPITAAASTITSKMDPYKADKIESFDKDAYDKYLQTFGKWKIFDCNDFKIYQNDLIKIWEDFSKQKLVIQKKSFFLIATP